MKVALIGASGNAGARILAELVQRGHEVTAIARNPDKIGPGATKTVAADIADPKALAEALKGADAVVSSVKFKVAPTQGLIDAVKASGIKRYIVVGGAGSLRHAGGVLEMDSAGFPEFVKPEARLGGAFLDELRASDLDWTFLSPSRMFEPGERTGKFRLGKDELLFDETGRSAISFEDYAVALVDELDNPKHIRERFTVGY